MLLLTSIKLLALTFSLAGGQQFIANSGLSSLFGSPRGSSQARQLSNNGDRPFNLNSLREAAVLQGQGFACAEKDTHFELVTGYVYTAPDDMLDSRPGTLMLTDCIELCRRNTTCKSANFETGLCVLFGSSAEEFPGMLKLRILHFPSFHNGQIETYLDL